MIFKFLCPQKPLHLYFWNHKNIGHVMQAGAFGAVRPVGAIPPTATAAGPSHSRSHGRLRRSEGPCRPVILGWWYFSDWPRLYDIDQNKKCRMMPRQITMSLDKRDCTCGTSQHETYETFCRPAKALWFSTLLATVVQCYTLTIRKLADSINAKR